MRVVIVGHHTRQEWVAKLQDNLPGSLCVMDLDGSGAYATHRKALQIAAEIGERVVIMEDDAIPVEWFLERASDWIDWFPDRLISFYLGTGRPHEWQPRVDRALEHAEDDFITLPTLIHGVCYTLPPDQVGRVLDRMRRGAADYAVGRAWAGPVLYPVESLVEHRDTGSVERHPDGERRTETRVARALAGPLMFDR